MGAKEEIARLEQKIDVLYNVVWCLMRETERHELAEHFRDDIIPYMDAVKLDEEFLDQLGKK